MFAILQSQVEASRASYNNFATKWETAQFQRKAKLKPNNPSNSRSKSFFFLTGRGQRKLSAAKGWLVLVLRNRRHALGQWQLLWKHDAEAGRVIVSRHLLKENYAKCQYCKNAIVDEISPQICFCTRNKGEIKEFENNAQRNGGQTCYFVQKIHAKTKNWGNIGRRLCIRKGSWHGELVNTNLKDATFQNLQNEQLTSKCVHRLEKIVSTKLLKLVFAFSEESCTKFPGNSKKKWYSTLF